MIVTPAPGRTARLPFWHGDGSGRDCGFGTAEGAFIRQVCTGLTDAAEAGHPRFDTRQRQTACVAVVVQHGKRRVLHRKAAALELVPSSHGVAELKKVDAERADLIKTIQQTTHRLARARYHGHLHHHLRDEALRTGKHVDGVIDDLIGAIDVENVQLDAHAQLVKARHAQAIEQRFVKEIAGGVQPDMGTRKALANVSAERHGLVGMGARVRPPSTLHG